MPCGALGAATCGFEPEHGGGTADAGSVVGAHMMTWSGPYPSATQPLATLCARRFRSTMYRWFESARLFHTRYTGTSPAGHAPRGWKVNRHTGLAAPVVCGQAMKLRPVRAQPWNWPESSATMPGCSYVMK